MSTANHTPGPWKASKGLPSIGWHVGMPGRWRLVVVGRDEKDESMSDGEIEANARLIAAAPELLDALKEMRRQYGTFHKGNCYISVCYERRLGVANQIADAAIAKAEGRAK